LSIANIIALTNPDSAVTPTADNAGRPFTGVETT
jgi:hypothetical protein